MRLFVSLTLPPEICRRAEEAAAHFAEAPGLRLVDPRLYHLTLKFIGDFPEQDLGRLEDELAKMSNNCSNIVLQSAGPLLFPNVKRPGVLCLRLEDLGGGSKKVAGLAAALEEAAARCGVEREGRPFRPHVTLGRIKAGREREAAPACERLVREWTELEQVPAAGSCEGFRLVRSRLRPGGPEYQVVAQFTPGGVAGGGDSDGQPRG